MDAKSCALSAETVNEIREKEEELVKVLQRLRELGVDYKKDFPFAESTGVASLNSTSASSDFSSANEEVDSTSEDIASGSESTIKTLNAQTAEVSNPGKFDRYQLPPEPRLEDFRITEDTMNMIRLNEQGLPFPMPPLSLKKRGLTQVSSESHFATEQRQQLVCTANYGGKQMFNTSNDSNPWTTPKRFDLSLEFVCTPDLYHTKRLMVPLPRSSKIPILTPRRDNGFNQGSEPTTTIHDTLASQKSTPCRPCEPEKRENRSRTVTPKERDSFFGLRSPVMPTFSSDFTFDNICHQAKEKNPEINSSLHSPVEPELKTISKTPNLHDKNTKESTIKISPELKSSLNWVKLK